MSRLTNPVPNGEGVSFGYSSNHISEWSLRPGHRATFFLLAVSACSIGLAYESARVAWVTGKLDSYSIPDIQKALRHDPDNADLIHWLGEAYSNFPTEINLSESVKYLRQAVRLNPHRWDFWSDLGTSCDFVGDTACSDEAFERAQVLNPMTPALQWALGNHYLLTNREEKAFPIFRQLLDVDPDYLDATFRLCMRAIRDPQAIYEEVVPHGKDASPRFAFLMFLSSTGDYESAMRIWGEMFSGPDRSPDLAMVKPFLDLLINNNQVQDAGTVWSDLQHAGVIPPEPNRQPGNLLYDASLAGPHLNTGFAWRINDSPELEFDFSDPSAYQGGKCLRINFVVGRNEDYDLLDQVVLIQPQTRYQLSAYVRSDNLSSDSGPRLRVIEMGCANCPARTSDPTLGTTAWHPIEVAFVTQAQTQAVRISFWRPQEPRGTGDIVGTVWLDDLMLRTVDTPQEPRVITARNR